jgi:hypothetical protein
MLEQHLKIIVSNVSPSKRFFSININLYLLQKGYKVATITEHDLNQPHLMEENMKACNSKKTIILSLGLLALTGCAPSMQPPTSQMALAQSAVDKASASGAYEYAPLELKSAQDKVEQAKAAMQVKDYVKAERLLEQAEIDAQLAEAKSTTSKSQKAVDTLQQGIDLLREEVQRKLPQ